MGVEMEAHIGFCIQAMQARAEELGLAGITTPPEGASAGA
jgi:hypothetical protein